MKLFLIAETVEDQIKNLSIKLKKNPDFITKIVKRIGGRYWKWVLNQWDKRLIRLPEDDYRVIETLKNFEINKKYLTNKDINTYKTINSLEEAIEAAHTTKKELDAVNISRDGVAVVNRYKEYTVIKISDSEALKDLGEGTKWCTRRSYPNCMAEDYLRDYGYINMVLKDSRPFIQYTPDLSQVMSVNETSIDNIPEVLSGVKSGSLDLFQLIFPDFDLIKRNLFADKSELNSSSGNPISSDQISDLGFFFELLSKLDYKKDIPVFDSLIMHLLENKKGFLLAANYASNVKKRRWKIIEPYLIKKPNAAVYYSEHAIRGRWPEAEESILDSLSYRPDICIDYAASVIKGRWPEAEAIILRDRRISVILNYSLVVVKERWPKGEDLLIKLAAKDPVRNSRFLVRYAYEIISADKKVRWPEAEPIILGGLSDFAIDYAAACTDGWPELENLLLEAAKSLNPDSDAISHVVSYVVKVYKKRWPEFELILKEFYNNRTRYGLDENLLRGRIEEYKVAAKGSNRHNHKLNESKNIKPKVVFGGFFNDGRVIVYIDGKRYEYVTPAFYHDKFKRMSLRSPLKTLNLIKKLNVSTA